MTVYEDLSLAAADVWLEMIISERWKDEMIKDDPNWFRIFFLCVLSGLLTLFLVWLFFFINDKAFKEDVLKNDPDYYLINT